LKNEGSLGQRRAVIHSVLHYLITNPDAKDGIDGILKYWLPKGQAELGREEAQAALDLLVSKGWLTVRQSASSIKLYGMNKHRLEEIKNFLHASETKGNG
jgi:hypothetical protein